MHYRQKKAHPNGWVQICEIEGGIYLRFLTNVRKPLCCRRPAGGNHQSTGLMN